MLRAYVTYRQDQWDEYLPAAEFTYNNSQQASTGFTPFELDCGQHPSTPITMTQPSQVPAANDFREHWETMMKIAKDSLMEAQDRQTKYANQHRRHLEFKVGDQVLLSMKKHQQSCRSSKTHQEAHQQILWTLYHLPSNFHYAYKLDLPANMKIHPVFISLC
jgi:hypothetical protein